VLAALCGLAAGPRVAHGGIPRFWRQLAQCETAGRWDLGAEHRAGEGSTFVGGLGIYEPNWEAWQVHVGVAGPAWSATPAEQVRVAAWGWVHRRAWWGCFRRVGTPDAEATAVLTSVLRGDAPRARRLGSARRGDNPLA